MKDANGLTVAYVYLEEEPGWRMAMHRLTLDEARRIAVNIVKLPELLGVRKIKQQRPWPAMIVPAPHFVSGYGVITQACEGDGSEEKRHHPTYTARPAGSVAVTRILRMSIRGNRPRGRIVSSCAIGYAVIPIIGEWLETETRFPA